MAIAAMILAIAYNPHFALMVTFGLSLLTCLALGTGISPLPGADGGDRGRRADAQRGPHPDQADQGRRDGGARLLRLDLGDGSLAGPAARPDPQRQLLAGRLGLDGRVLPGRQPAVPRERLRDRHRDQPAGAGRHHPPAAQELVRRAPGTHNHSITVGAIAEAAAERIGANALLVRIGAYFHDIGKMLKPHYFVENQVGATNRHANLAPAMSTLIIIGHVKDGVDLGRQHHLPEPIIDLIEQHHGTTLVEYFYHEANRRNGANPDGSAVHESAFRYPGPEAADQGGRHPDDRRLPSRAPAGRSPSRPPRGSRGWSAT